MDLKSFEKRKYLKHRKNIKIKNNVLRTFEINKKPKFRRKKWKKKDKTNGNFTDYADIYPEINNNSFEIKIKMKKNGSCILLNDKYEIIFNIDNTNYIKVTLNINNNYYSWVHNIKYKETEFVKYIFKIIDNKLIIKGKNNFEIKQAIDEKYFNSIRIKSLSNSETFWDYKEVKMKMDDDICYLDIERFDEYINYIKISKNNITFPNLVNHAVSVFYNNKNGLVPNSELKYRYQNRKSAWDIFDYYADGQQGKKIHEYFLNNIDKFTHNNFTPILLNGLKPSICAFGITREVYQKSYLSTAIFPNESMAKTYIFGDEPYASKLLNNYLYPRFICIHFAFGYQRTSGISDSLLAIYKNLAKKYIIPDDS